MLAIWSELERASMDGPRRSEAQLFKDQFKLSGGEAPVVRWWERPPRHHEAAVVRWREGSPSDHEATVVRRRERRPSKCRAGGRRCAVKVDANYERQSDQAQNCGTKQERIAEVFHSVYSIDLVRLKRTPYDTEGIQ